MSTRLLTSRVRKALTPPSDPGLGALRRAARATIVIPALFAFTALLLREPQILIFVIFGTFSMLVISDFGGRRPPRALAYLSATVGTAGLVALGTLASAAAVPAIALTFVVGLVISFSRVFGGYVTAANTAMLLSFVIAVTIPAPESAIPERVGGWAIAGLVSTLAAVALWPRLERVAMQRHAATALEAIARLVEAYGAGQGDLHDLEEIAARAVESARHGFIDMATRPISTARRERAFAQVLVELDRIVQMIERPFGEGRPALRPHLPETDDLIAVVATVLRSSAKSLTRGGEPDVRAIELARDQHRKALDIWAGAQLKSGRPVEEVLDGLDFDHTLRVVAYVALALAGNVLIASGARPDFRDEAARIARSLRAHLEASSTVLQGSLRVAVGLALAVWVARFFDLSHAFWVVLGTIQVLRSNALGTGRTVLQAIAGNAAGVVIGGLFALISGNHPVLMWAAFPVAVFLAAYAATTVGFVASQAAFTINLIIVFNLISPAGWQVGLVRLEDLAVGAAISLVVGVLLWPRGARRELVRALGGFYRSLVQYLDKVFDQVLGFDAPENPDQVRAPLARARDRADTAFDAFMTERGASPSDRETAAFLLSSANHVSLAGDLLDLIARGMGYRATGGADGEVVVHDQVSVLLTGYRHIADRLELSASTQSEAEVSEAALRRAALGYLRRWQADPEVGRSAMAVVMAGEWLKNLARLERDVDSAVITLSESARKPWWR